MDSGAPHDGARITALLQENWPLEVVKTPDRGRIAVAIRDIKQGEIFLRTAPYGYCLSDNSVHYVCDHCTKPNYLKGFSIHCENCRRVYYCSEVCKDAAKSHHYHECGPLKKLDSKFSAYEFQMAGLVIRTLSRKKRDNLQPEGCLSVNYSDTRHLISHYDDFQPEKIICFETITDHILSMKDEDSFLDVPKEEIMEILSKTECNCYGYWGIPGESGIGVFPLASYFNHSCSPNSFRFEDGLQIYFRASMDITVGSEILTTYIDTHESYDYRQSVMREGFFFSCCCNRCNVEKDHPRSLLNSKSKPPLISCPLPECKGSFQEDSDLCSVCGLKRIGSRVFINLN